MSGYKVWAADDVLAAADLNSFLMAQSVPRFADVSTRAGAILAPVEGQLTYRSDANVFELWNGAAWVALGSAVGTVPNATYSATSGTAVFSNNADKVRNITIFNSSTTPTANAVGDLWFY